MNRHTDPERGAALVLAMLLIVVLTAVGGTLTSSVRRTATRTLLDVGRADALAAADAGVALARVRLAADPSWTAETIEVGRSTVDVRAEPLGEHGYRVVAAATSRPAGANGGVVRDQLEVELELRDAMLPAVVAWRSATD